MRNYDDLLNRLVTWNFVGQGQDRHCRQSQGGSRSGYIRWYFGNIGSHDISDGQRLGTVGIGPQPTKGDDDLQPA